MTILLVLTLTWNFDGATEGSIIAVGMGALLHHRLRQSTTHAVSRHILQLSHAQLKQHLCNLHTPKVKYFLQCNPLPLQKTISIKI